jgi:hypothetical protein
MRCLMDEVGLEADRLCKSHFGKMVSTTLEDYTLVDHPVFIWRLTHALFK